MATPRAALGRVGEGRAALAPEVRGILLILLAMACFALMDGISKFLVSHYPPVLVLWLRHLAAVPVAFLILWRRRPLTLLRTRAPLLQVGRAALLVTEMGMVLVAFRAMPLGDVTAILAATPLFVTALSVPLLGERVGWRRWLAVGVGFLGVLVIVRPGVGVLQPAAVIAAVSALMYAVYTVLTRMANVRDSAETGFLLQICVAAALLTVIGPFFWVTPELAHWPIILAQATLGAFGHLFMVRALSLAPPVVVQPFTYTQVPYEIGLGFLLFADVPDRWMLAGAALVIGSGVYAAVRTHKRAVAGAA